MIHGPNSWVDVKPMLHVAEIRKGHTVCTDMINMPTLAFGFLMQHSEATSDWQCPQAHQICFTHLLGLFLYKGTSQVIIT